MNLKYICLNFYTFFGIKNKLRLNNINELLYNCTNKIVKNPINQLLNNFTNETMNQKLLPYNQYNIINEIFLTII